MRSEWTRWVSTVAVSMTALTGGLLARGAGAAEVRNVEAKYGWPWGRACISYEVVGTIETNTPLYVSAKDQWHSRLSYAAASSALSGDLGTEEGKHQLVWDFDKQGLNITSSPEVLFTVKYVPLYCVVDLSGGDNALSYPVTFMNTPPSDGFNTDEYKTTKLVLRRIEEGTFLMGTNKVQVTLTRPYYMGLFEVTQKQYSLVMGSNPSKFSGDKRPVEQVSWNTIQGSFWRRLCSRTGLAFNLPTEAQWEYACRAGTTTTYSYGESANGKYMWCRSNSSSQTHDVGTTLPNGWGLYDMHGNVAEWCHDWWAWHSSLSGGTDPTGPSSGEYRMLRGGGGWSDAKECTSSARSGHDSPSSEFYGSGFRLIITL